MSGASSEPGGLTALKPGNAYVRLARVIAAPSATADSPEPAAPISNSRFSIFNFQFPDGQRAGADATAARVTATPSRHSRPALARKRAAVARAALTDCHLCAHHCGVNRLAAQHGRCHAGPDARFFSAQTEVGDERELLPTFAIALSGCDLRCDFCISGASSWNARAGRVLDAPAMATRARDALNQGAATIQLLGGEPTIHLPSILELVAGLPGNARLVLKTNGHGSAEARQLLEGMFDVWVVDFKFGNPVCARRLAQVADYLPVVKENLLWARQHTDLIVRHLLMPGHIDCCWQPVAEWIAGRLPGVKVSLRAGFWPAWHSARHPELRRCLATAESARAFKIGSELGLNLIP